jgi:DNA polymerase-3 subunit delta'
MSFGSIFCQDRVVTALQRAYAGDKVTHACLFAGPDGVGRFLTAQTWARLLLCLRPVESGGFWEGCGQCESCRLLEGEGHPDFQHVYKELREYTADGKGKAAPVDLPIDVIREFLIAKVGHKPTLSPRRVFIVSEAEKLNIASQNALLKILEEPPANCCIVLLCTRLEKLLPTIRSRVQILRFGSIARDRVVAVLTEAGAAPDQAHFFAALGQGSLGTSLTYWRLAEAGRDLYALKRELVVRVTALAREHVLIMAETCLNAAKKLAECWAQIEPETSKTDLSRRAQKTVVQILITLWEDAMKTDLRPAKEAIHADQIQDIEPWARRLGPEAAVDRVRLGYEALRRIEAGVNDRLVFEWLLLRGQGSGILTGL